MWSGYGEIARYRSVTLDRPVIIKHISPPAQPEHPRGWNTPLSHQRKIRSYEVEYHFYREWSKYCEQNCRVPGFVDAIKAGEQCILVLEDLDSAGLSRRLQQPGIAQVKQCLTWLAAFHARFLAETPKNLWQTGCYWHLATRPDELASMPPSPLKDNADKIDAALQQASWQTVVHGDAKIANFCFADAPKNNSDSQSTGNVAALDFQYVGRGIGMKDVMMFLGSCMSEAQLFASETALMDHYFVSLERALQQRNTPIDFSALKHEWLRLYSFVWADFERFLTGWKPDHFKLNRYMKAQTQKCLDELNC